jgi:hypothetical protein
MLGKERTNLTGTYIDKKATRPARLQVPGSIRVDKPNWAPVLISLWRGRISVQGNYNKNRAVRGNADRSSGFR